MLDSLVDNSLVLRLPGGVLEKAMRDAEGEEVHRIFNITMCGEQRQALYQALYKISLHTHTPVGFLEPAHMQVAFCEPGHSLHIYQPARALVQLFGGTLC